MLYNSTLPPIDFSGVRVLAFDKDETITPANKPLEIPMAMEIQRLTKNRYIVILTARDIDICKKHIIETMDAVKARKDRLIFGCCNGSQIYEYDFQSNDYILKSQLQGEIESEDFFENITETIKKEFDLPEMTFERRSDTMGTFVCISRDSDTEKRKKFDPDKSRRKKIIERLRNFLPEKYEIIAGGSTSIDVGIYDKESGMRHLMDYFNYPICGDIIFFGDNFNGGNDTPVEKISDIYSVKVKNPDDTKRLLGQID